MTDLARIARAVLDAYDAIAASCNYELTDAELAKFDRIFKDACDESNLEQMQEVAQIMSAEREQQCQQLRAELQACRDRLREKVKAQERKP